MIDELIIVSCICGWVILGWYYYGLRIQVKAQQTHIEQLQFYQTLFEQVPLNLTCYQLDGHIQAMNQAARVFWGVQSEHFESIRQQYNLFDDAQLQQSGMDALIRKAFAGNIVSMPDMHYLPEQTPSLEDKRLISRDVRGHLYPIKHQGTVIGVVLQHEDVTTLNQQAVALKDSRTKLQAILDYAPVLISMKDLKGNVILTNQQFNVLQGGSAESYIGQSIFDLFPPEIAAPLWQNDVQVQQTLQPLEIEEQIIHQDGSLHTYLTVKFPIIDEQGALCSTGAISTDITEQKRAQHKLMQQAFYDDLTGLPNRHLFSDRLSQHLVFCQRHNRHAALLLLDIDHFKFINDSLGHPVGDSLIIHIAKLLQHHLREEDSICRLSGDEFLILLTELTRNETQRTLDILNVVQKLQRLIQMPIELKGHSLQIDSTVGVVLIDGNKLSAMDLIRQADIAMYRAKEKARGSVEFFESYMQQSAMQRLLLEQDLRQAIDLGQLFLVYQPQVEREGELFGAECLIRWRPAAEAEIGPAQFIPVAEETGLIVSMGYWIMRTACLQLANWRKDYVLPEGFHLAINVSPRQFNHADFVDTVLHIIQQAELNPAWIELEITENLLLANLDQILPKMQRLRRAGIRFSIDDFGTGYSSLSYLKRLPLSRLKIDQSFVRDIEADPDDAAIVETIITMAKLLKLGVVAEGVETVGQYAFLRQHGCEYFQGYYFHRPLSLAQFDQLLVHCDFQPACGAFLPQLS